MAEQTEGGIPAEAITSEESPKNEARDSREVVISSFHEAFVIFESYPEELLTPEQRAARDLTRDIKEKTLDQNKSYYRHSFTGEDGKRYSENTYPVIDPLITFLRERVHSGELSPEEEAQYRSLEGVLHRNAQEYFRGRTKKLEDRKNARIRQEARRIAADPRLTTGDPTQDFLKAYQNLFEWRELISPPVPKEAVETPPPDGIIEPQPPVPPPPFEPGQTIEPPIAGGGQPPDREKPSGSETPRGQDFPYFVDTDRAVDAAEFKKLYPQEIEKTTKVIDAVKELIPKKDGESDDDYQERVLSEVENRLRFPGNYKGKEDELYKRIVNDPNLPRPDIALMAVETGKIDLLAQINQKLKEQYSRDLSKVQRRDVKTEVTHVGEPSYIEGDYEHYFQDGGVAREMPKTDLYGFTLVADRLLDTHIPSQSEGTSQSYRERMRELENILKNPNTPKDQTDQAANLLVDIRKDFYNKVINNIKNVDNSADFNPQAKENSDEATNNEMRDILFRVRGASLDQLIDQYQGVSSALSPKHQAEMRQLLTDQKPFLLDYTLKGADLMRRRISYNISSREVPSSLRYKRFVQGPQDEPEPRQRPVGLESERPTSETSESAPEVPEVVEENVTQNPASKEIPSEVVEDEDKPVEPETLEEVIREFAILNRTLDVRQKAAETTVEQLTEEMRKGRGWEFWNWPRKIALRLGWDYFRQKDMERAVKAKLENHNSYLDFDVINNKLKDANAHIAEEREAAQAKVEEVKRGGQREGQTVVETQGQLKTMLINEVLKPIIDGQVTDQPQIQEKLKQFVKDHENDSQVQTVFGRDATQYGRLADYFASDLLEMGEMVKQDLEAHRYALEQLDQHVKIKLANTSWGAETQANFDMVDKAVVWAQSGKYRGWLLNPAVIGAASSLATFGLFRVAGATASASRYVVPVVGTLFGAGVAAARRNHDLKVDRATHQVERAYNMTPSPTKAPRREALERFAYDMASVEDLLNRLSGAGADREGVMRAVAEIEARRDFSKREKVDLITFASQFQTEQGRGQLDKAVVEARQRLKDDGVSDDEISEMENRFTGEWNQKFIKNRQQQDNEFTHYRVKEAAKAGAFGAVAGLTSGFLVHEVVAGVSNLAGHPTVSYIAEAAKNFGITHAGTRSGSGLNAESVRNLLPNVPINTTESGHLIAHGDIPPQVRAELTSKGFTLNEIGEGTVDHKAVLGPEGEWTKHATNVDHRLRYSYDQPGSQGNELHEYTFKRGKIVTIDMSTMKEGWQHGINPDHVNVQETINSGKSGFYITTDAKPQDGIWVSDASDGVLDGKINLDPDDYTHMIDTPNGKMPMADVAKMVVNQNALQKLPDGNIATEFGKQNVFNLSVNGKPGFIEAGSMIREGDKNVLQVFATISGTSGLPSTIDIPAPPAIEIIPPEFIPTPEVGVGDEIPLIPFPFAPRYPLEPMKPGESRPSQSPAQPTQPSETPSPTPERRGQIAPLTPEEQERRRTAEEQLPPLRQKFQELIDKPDKTPEERQQLLDLDNQIRQLESNLEFKLGERPLNEYFNEIQGPVNKDSPFFIQDPQGIQDTLANMSDEEAGKFAVSIPTNTKPFFIQEGNYIRPNPEVTPALYFEQAQDQRFANAEAATNRDSGLFALAAASAETPQQQAQLYFLLTGLTIAAHEVKPALLTEWLTGQTQPLNTETTFSPLVYFRDNDHINDDLRQGLRPENERRLAYNPQGQLDPGQTITLWQERIGELKERFDNDNFEPHHLRWVEFLSHSVDMPRLMQMLKEQQPATQTPQAQPPPPVRPTTPGSTETLASEMNVNLTSLETLSDQESQEIISRTNIIHATPFLGKELTPQILANEGLAPKYKVELGNQVTAYLSNPYDIGDGRQAVTVYVQKGDQTVARSYWRSNSQGLWRYLPEYQAGWYHKGYGEESVPATIPLQQALAQLTKEGSQPLQVSDNLFMFAGTTRSNREGTYFRETDREPMRLEGNFYTENDKVKIPPEQVEFTNPNQAPDFSKPLSSWEQNTSLYGRIRVEVFPSKDGNLKFLFCKDSEGRAWIAGIEDDSEIQTTGLHKSWIHAGDLTTPAFEYSDYDGGFGGQVRRREYIDMFPNYLSKIPVIKEYLSGPQQIPPPQAPNPPAPTPPKSPTAPPTTETLESTAAIKQPPPPRPRRQQPPPPPPSQSRLREVGQNTRNLAGQAANAIRSRLAQRQQNPVPEPEVAPPISDKSRSMDLASRSDRELFDRLNKINREPFEEGGQNDDLIREYDSIQEEIDRRLAPVNLNVSDLVKAADEITLSDNPEENDPFTMMKRRRLINATDRRAELQLNELRSNINTISDDELRAMQRQVGEEQNQLPLNYSNYTEPQKILDGFLAEKAGQLREEMEKRGIREGQAERELIKQLNEATSSEKERIQQELVRRWVPENASAIEVAQLLEQTRQESPNSDTYDLRYDKLELLNHEVDNRMEKELNEFHDRLQTLSDDELRALQEQTKATQQAVKQFEEADPFTDLEKSLRYTIPERQMAIIDSELARRLPTRDVLFDQARVLLINPEINNDRETQAQTLSARLGIDLDRAYAITDQINAEQQQS